MAKTPNWRDILSLHLRTLRDIEKYVPGRIPCLILTNIVYGLSPYVTVWFSAQFINELASLRRREMLVQWIILTLVVTGVVEILKTVLGNWYTRMEFYHNPKKGRQLMEKLLDTDFANVDDQHFRDLQSQTEQFTNINGAGANKALETTDKMLQAGFGILGAVALTVSLFTQRVPAGDLEFLNSPLSILVILAVMAGMSILGAMLSGQLGSMISAIADDTALGNRKFSYYCTFGKQQERFLDTRTYQQNDLFESFCNDTPFKIGGMFDKVFSGRYAVMTGIGEALGTIFTGFVYVFTCLKAWAGAFGIGSVTQYVSAVTSLSGNIEALLSGLTSIKNNDRFLRLYYEIIDTPDQMYQGSLTTEKRADRQYDVEFRDVSFRYPNAENWALRHVNIKFKVGRKLAIVGENGSGKTTFIKLLCRLYDPQEGQILLNGIDIRKYRYDDYMNIFSVVFQDFHLLSQPLGCNVAGGKEYDRARVERALRDAGFDERLDSLKDGLDTMLYKDFSEDGVLISGGEAQKIAIARALYKDAPFIILDEPTAALDPITEAEIYEKFNDIVGDKTAVYISHRLSSCKFCDEIAVFDGGAIVQHGAHEALLADADGKYAALWNAQAQYYVTETA